MDFLADKANLPFTKVLMSTLLAIFFTKPILGQISDFEDTPLFSGTTHTSSSIILPYDTSVLKSVRPVGVALRNMNDNRVGKHIMVHPFIFRAEYFTDDIIEIRVNPEFEKKELALFEAQKYARMIGQLPRLLRTKMKVVDINRGDSKLSGSLGSVTIHTGSAEDLDRHGTLEEALIHEGAHVALDGVHYNTDWLRAQNADSAFISDYAQENPLREDIAESFVIYMALNFNGERATEALESGAQTKMFNRLKYFDSQGFDLSVY